MKPGPRIIVALDFPSQDRALDLVEQLDPDRCRVKVGKEMFTRLRPVCVERLRGRGFEVYERYGCSVLCVEEVPRNETNKYGIVETESGPDGELRVTSIVEKPAPADAPSNLAVVGRYLLTPRIFTKLEQTGQGAGGEIQLTDGISALLEDEPVIAYPFQGKRYDCGSKLGYLQPQVEFGLEHGDLGGDFRAYLKSLML